MSRFDATFGYWFWSNVNMEGRDNPEIGRCWEWTGSKTPAGYGQLQRRKISQRPLHAHRVSWEMETGQDPGELHVLHRCDNPCCVRPSHLFTGTQTDNNADRTKKGRTASGDRNGARTQRERNPFVRNGGSGLVGEKHPMAKLTDEQRKALINDFASLQGVRRLKTFLARKYGISLTHVSRILKGEVGRAEN